jgi:hypothetical protein
MPGIYLMDRRRRQGGEREGKDIRWGLEFSF